MQFGHARTLTEDEKLVLLSYQRPDLARGRTELGLDLAAFNHKPNGCQLDMFSANVEHCIRSYSICSHVVTSYNWCFIKRELNFLKLFYLFHIFLAKEQSANLKPIEVTENSFSWNIKEEEGIKFHAGKKTTASALEKYLYKHNIHSVLDLSIAFCFFEYQDSKELLRIIWYAAIA